MNSADIAWMLMATALVLLMTPGVAFFYGGMVRARHAVSTLLQSYAALGVVGLLWAVCGYSLVFSGDASGFIGDLTYFMLNGVGMEPNADYAPTIPHVLFVLFQGTFAIITPALITGAVAERIRFRAWLPIMAIWSLAVYVPVAHWVWGPGGWIGALGGLDFAGGLVVHMTSGFAALTAALMVGKRTDFNEAKEQQGFHVPMILLGTALLWFGWFGFNAGSALGANALAAQAAGTTLFAAAASMTAWMLYDWFKEGKPSAIGACVGAVAGLVAITPAAGFVTLQAALIIGLASGIVCNVIAKAMKKRFQLDDTLDVFACHGIGGTLGALLTAVFATTTINPDGADGLLYGSSELFMANLTGVVAVIGYTMAATWAIIKVVSFFTKVRASEDEEKSGLGITQHGESALVLE